MDGGTLTGHESTAARAARAALGRAIRTARWRRAHPEPLSVVESAVALPRDTRAFQRAMLAVGAFAVVTILVIALLPGLRPSPTPAAAPPEPIARPMPTLAPAGGRGRTLETPSPLAVVPVATPPPATSAPPSVEPTQAPAPEAAAPVQVGPPATGAPGGAPSGVPGGVPGGTPGGVPGGVPGGTGTGPAITPAPTPAGIYLPSGTPPPQAQGSERFFFKVIDSVTRTPLPDVCVIYGQYTSCLFTNSDGLYWLDVPPNGSRWSFYFSRSDYWPTEIIEQYVPGMGSVPTTVYLRHK